MDLVNKKYHGNLKVMIDELRRITNLEDVTAWWQVKKLVFIHPKSMRNYEPIAKFIMQVTQDGNKGLNCSIRTFIWYLTSAEHSNLSIKQESAKALIYNMIRYMDINKNGIL
jgi:hypothetical protein